MTSLWEACFGSKREAEAKRETCGLQKKRQRRKKTSRSRPHEGRKLKSPVFRGNALTYQEASEFTGISKRSLYYLVKMKRIPHVRLGPRTIRFELVALLDWFRDRQTCSPEVKQ